MAWVRVDDAFYDHPKFAAAGPLGIAQWLTGLAWANRNLTDGFIPAATAKRLLDWEGVAWRMWMGDAAGGGEDADGLAVAEHLVECGLWDHAEGGYEIHDYLKFQPSRDEVRDQHANQHEKKVLAGKRRAAGATRDEKGRLVSPGQNQHTQHHGQHATSTPPASDPPPVQPQPQPQEEETPSSAPPPAGAGAGGVEAFEIDFALAWQHYPRKDGRKAALRAYQARRRAGISADELLTATKHYALTRQGEESRFTKHGSTFFGPDEHWKDYLQPPAPPARDVERDPEYAER